MNYSPTSGKNTKETTRTWGAEVAHFLVLVSLTALFCRRTGYKLTSSQHWKITIYCIIMNIWLIILNGRVTKIKDSGISKCTRQITLWGWFCPLSNSLLTIVSSEAPLCVLDSQWYYWNRYLFQTYRPSHVSLARCTVVFIPPILPKLFPSELLRHEFKDSQKLLHRREIWAKK